MDEPEDLTPDELDAMIADAWTPMDCDPALGDPGKTMEFARGLALVTSTIMHDHAAEYAAVLDRHYEAQRAGQ